MQIDLTWAGLGVIVAIAVHAFYTIRWASKVEYRLTSIAESFIDFKNSLIKRDEKIDAIGSRLDQLRERVIRIEVGADNHNRGAQDE